MSFCGKIELMRNNLNTQDQYKIFEGNNQLVLVLNSEILLPEDAPVRVTSAQLEELDYSKLYEAYSSKCTDRIAVSCTGLQPQKAVDETAKKKVGNPLF